MQEHNELYDVTCNMKTTEENLKIRKRCRFCNQCPNLHTSLQKKAKPNEQKRKKGTKRKSQEQCGTRKMWTQILRQGGKIKRVTETIRACMDRHHQSTIPKCVKIEKS